MNDVIANPLRSGLGLDRTTDACAVVIFGASGDLTKRKLVPALYNLAASRALPGGFAVTGVARRTKTHDQFRAEMKDAVSKFSRRKPLDEAVWSDFSRALGWVSGDFTSAKTYEDLRTHLEACDRERGTRKNRLFYLAVPPSEFGAIALGLREANLVSSSDATFTRVVFEKPFGHDLASPRALNDTIASVFREPQV